MTFVDTRELQIKPSQMLVTPVLVYAPATRPNTRKTHMKRLLSYSVLGLALTLTIAGCDRAKNPQPARADATANVVAFQKIDTVAGTGKEAIAGSSAMVHYTGWLFDPTAPSQHGAKFDSSVGGSPFTFKVGGGQVIKGWDEGVQGMKVGGKRTLILPPEMGYGAGGAGPIPPNANLIFDVELLDVR